MKLAGVLVLVIILAIGVAARENGGIFELVEFSNDMPIQAALLTVGDAVHFNLKGHEHLMYPTQIFEKNIKLRIFRNAEDPNSTGVILPLKAKDSILLDLDKDETDDLRVRIFEIDPANENENASVTLIFESLGHAPNPFTIDEENQTTAGSEITGGAVVEQKQNYTPYLIIGGIILALLGLLHLRKKGPGDGPVPAMSAPVSREGPLHPAQNADVHVDDISFEDEEKKESFPPLNDGNEPSLDDDNIKKE